jgi:hypothetical protein
MEIYNIYGEQNGDHSAMYPQSDGNGSISDAPTIAKGDQDALEGFDEALRSYQAKYLELDKVHAMAKEYCAIGRGSKKSEDGRQALEHTRAERMVVWNFGEKDIKAIRVIRLAAHGIYAADMMDIDAMGVPGPEGHCRHIDDWKSNEHWFGVPFYGTHPSQLTPVPHLFNSSYSPYRYPLPRSFLPYPPTYPQLRIVPSVRPLTSRL